MSATSTAWKHIRRSPYQALAAIFIMAQTFFVISIFTFLFFGSYIIVRYYETRPQLSVFFTDEAKDEDIRALESDIKSTGKVLQMTFIDKEEAFKRYTELFKDEPAQLELAEPDMLPRSFDITTHNLEDQLELAKTIRNSPIVSDIALPKDAIEGFTKLTNVLRKLGAVTSIVLALDSIFLIMLIISMKISQKKKEMEILKLLSATNWYIRWPFILEGVFYGVTGALIGWVTASAGLLYLSPFLQSQLPADVPLFPVDPLFLLWILGAEILIAIILGIFSSILAALRYLK